MPLLGGQCALATAGMLLLAAAVVFGSPRPDQPGALAPALSGRGVVIVQHQDRATSTPMLILFTKPDDQHSAEAVETIAAFHAHHARLRDASQTTVILSRSNGEAAAAPPATPRTWRVLHDTQDVLYGIYGIIATPTAIVVGADGRTVGFHPGYNASMVDAIRRDLISAIDGPEALTAATPTPGIMNVQMGRTLARRGLYERALGYYHKATELEALPCDIMLEVVEIHLQLEQADEALKVLDGIPLDEACAASAAGIRARALALKADGPPAEAKPPAVP